MLPNNPNTVPLSIEDLKFYLVPFVNSMPEGFIMIDRNAAIVVANSRCHDMFGYKDGELTGKNLSILIPAVFGSIHSKHIQNFFSSPHSRPMGTSGMQLSGLKNNGIQFPIEVSLGVYHALEGMYAMAFIIDITNKQLMDAALKQSEQRFRQVFQAAPVAISVVRRNNNSFIDVNQRFLEITGYAKDEILGNSPVRLETLVAKPAYKKIMRLLEEREEVRDLETSLTTRSGSATDILLSIEKIKLNEEVTYIIMFNDISRIKYAETQLKSERNFINTVLETVGALIIVQDAKGAIINLNNECRKVLGYPLKEIKGKTPWEIPLMPKELIPVSLEIFNNLLVEGKPSQSEGFWKTKSGKKRLIKWSNTVLKNEKGKVEFIIRTGIDITESKKLEMELLNAVVEGEEKERLRLAKELHDGLSPILSSVRNNLEVIGPGIGKLEGKKQRYFDNSISLLKNAMDEVRTMSKDLMPPSLQDFGFILALKQLCERIDNTNGIKVNFYSSDGKPRYNSHIETGLYRIAQELINNAIKHSGADTINVHVVPHKKSVVLSVEDNGLGFMPSENKDKGFGLKNISSRVKSLNGFVSIDSRVKKGTLATIEVPV